MPSNPSKKQTKSSKGNKSVPKYRGPLPPKNSAEDSVIIQGLRKAYPKAPLTDAKVIMALVASKTRMSVPVTITPAIAEKLLGLNNVNRKLRQAKVELWSAVMAAGKWNLDGQAIMFAPNDMLNGQHRLAACILSGVPFDTFIVTGMDESFRTNYDSGTRRTVSDNLQMEGYINGTQLGAAVQWCIRYSKGGYISGNNKSMGNVTVDEALDFLEANPTLADAVNWAKKHKSGQHKGITHTMLATLMFEAKGLADLVQDFVNAYTSMLGWYEGHPARTLHNFVAKRQGNHKVVTPVYNAALVKAFNAFVLGNDLRAIPFKYKKNADGTRSERYSEEFPRIITIEDERLLGRTFNAIPTFDND